MSGSAEAARERRLSEIVGAVARQALEDWRVRRIALLDDGSPEAELSARWLGEALPADALLRVAPEPGVLESVLQTAGFGSGGEVARAEVRRMLARLEGDVLPALPANKTVLLLGGALPPEPLLPLGDLYASEVQVLVGRWSGPEPVTSLAERAGGVERLDGALRLWFDGRDAAAMSRLPEESREEVLAALRRGSASRLAPRIVPKIGYRTLGVDLFE